MHAPIFLEGQRGARSFVIVRAGRGAIASFTVINFVFLNLFLYNSTAGLLFLELILFSKSWLTILLIHMTKSSKRLFCMEKEF